MATGIVRIKTIPAVCKEQIVLGLIVQSWLFRLGKHKIQGEISYKLGIIYCRN